MNLTKCTKSQRRVITTLDAPLMVSAGAGSGKTFTLTQRVAYALSPHDGQPPFLDSVDELLAITFTTKAADELKSRIKGLLLDEGLEQEALKADNAWVSTIHGMASRILREHALEIGIDPAFEVIGDDRRDELMEEALELVVRQARDGDDARLAELLRTEKLRGTGFNDKGVVDYAQAVLERVHAMPEGFDTLATGEGKDSPHHLMRLLEEAAEALEERFNFSGEAGRGPRAGSRMARCGAGRACRRFRRRRVRCRGLLPRVLRRASLHRRTDRRGVPRAVRILVGNARRAGLSRTRGRGRALARCGHSGGPSSGRGLSALKGHESSG